MTNGTSNPVSLTGIHQRMSDEVAFIDACILREQEMSNRQLQAINDWHGQMIKEEQERIKHKLLALEQQRDRIIDLL